MLTRRVRTCWSVRRGLFVRAPYFVLRIWSLQWTALLTLRTIGQLNGSSTLLDVQLAIMPVVRTYLFDAVLFKACNSIVSGYLKLQRSASKPMLAEVCASLVCQPNDVSMCNARDRNTRGAGISTFLLHQ